MLNRSQHSKSLATVFDNEGFVDSAARIQGLLRLFGQFRIRFCDLLPLEAAQRIAAHHFKVDM